MHILPSTELPEKYNLNTSKKKFCTPMPGRWWYIIEKKNSKSVKIFTTKKNKNVKFFQLFGRWYPFNFKIEKIFNFFFSTRAMSDL